MHNMTACQITRRLKSPHDINGCMAMEINNYNEGTPKPEHKTQKKYVYRLCIFYYYNVIIILNVLLTFLILKI